MSETPISGELPSQSGVLEFSCSQCGRQLRVSQEAAVGVVKCPACGHVQRPADAASTPSSQVTPVAPSASSPSASSPSASSPPPVASPSSAGSSPSQTKPTAQATARAAPTPPVVANAQAATKASAVVNVSPRLSIDEITAPTDRETETQVLFYRILEQVAKIYVGQDELVLGTLVALFSSGHVLIESVPGLGKTLFVRTLGRVLGCEFGRIQFTADLMPSDITGAPIFDMKTQEFRFRPGPVFTQLLLADEINRSPAKTHAALLETMQEYRVTVDGVSHELQRPFLVLATQNPIESEGTYNLPEAQLDRFMFKLVADYPSEREEADILTLHSRQVDINQRLIEDVETITSPEAIRRVTEENSDVRVDERLIDYINKIVRMTREWPQFHMGASPRAGLALMQGARTLASFYGRDYAVPDDVVQIALPVLRHRVILTAEADVEGHQVDVLLTDLIRTVEVPRL